MNHGTLSHLDFVTKIMGLEQEHGYNYLGVRKVGRIHNTQTKENVRKENYRRMRVELTKPYQLKIL